MGQEESRDDTTQRMKQGKINTSEGSGVEWRGVEWKVVEGSARGGRGGEAVLRNVSAEVWKASPSVMGNSQRIAPYQVKSSQVKSSQLR